MKKTISGKIEHISQFNRAVDESCLHYVLRNEQTGRVRDVIFFIKEALLEKENFHSDSLEFFISIEIENGEKIEGVLDHLNFAMYYIFEDEYNVKYYVQKCNIGNKRLFEIFFENEGKQAKISIVCRLKTNTSPTT